LVFITTIDGYIPWSSRESLNDQSLLVELFTHEEGIDGARLPFIQQAFTASPKTLFMARQNHIPIITAGDGDLRRRNRSGSSGY
jgi:hypothetical protein